MSSQDDTNLLKSIAASLIAEQLDTKEERRRMRRAARGAYDQAVIGGDAYASKLEGEISRLETQVERMHEHADDDPLHVSLSEYDALFNVWRAVAKNDGSEASQTAQAEALEAANARLGDPDA